MSEQHTRGPWVEGKAGASIVSADAGAVAEQQGQVGKDHIAFYGGAMICESVAPRDRPIIMAAPAMLKALKWALPFVAAATLDPNDQELRDSFAAELYQAEQAVRDAEPPS